MAYLHQATLWHIPSFVEIQGSVLPWAIATVVQARLLGHLPDVGQPSLWVDIFFRRWWCWGTLKRFRGIPFFVLGLKTYKQSWHLASTFIQFNPFWGKCGENSWMTTQHSTSILPKLHTALVDDGSVEVDWFWTVTSMDTKNKIASDGPQLANKLYCESVAIYHFHIFPLHWYDRYDCVWYVW